MPQTAESRVLLLGTENADGSVAGVTTGTSIPILRKTDAVPCFFLRSIGATTGGTIIIEEADWGPMEAPYSGTWSQLASVAASTFTGTAQSAQKFPDASYSYLRVRIGSPITGGGSVMVSWKSRGAA